MFDILFGINEYDTRGDFCTQTVCKRMFNHFISELNGVKGINCPNLLGKYIYIYIYIYIHIYIEWL